MRNAQYPCSFGLHCNWSEISKWGANRRKVSARARIICTVSSGISLVMYCTEGHVSPFSVVRLGKMQGDSRQTRLYCIKKRRNIVRKVHRLFTIFKAEFQYVFRTAGLKQHAMQVICCTVRTSPNLDTLGALQRRGDPTPSFDSKSVSSLDPGSQPR